MAYLFAHFADIYEYFIIVTTPVFIICGIGLAFYGLIYSRIVAYVMAFF